MPSPPPNGAPHVLILSDDSLLRELVAELLSKERFTVAEAASPEEAALRCRERAPAVVLVDAMADGELAWPLLEDPDRVLGDATPSVVILTGSATPPEVRNHPGADQLLPPPLTSEMLVGVMRHRATWPPRKSGTRLRPDLRADLEAAAKKKAE